MTAVAGYGTPQWGRLPKAIENTGDGGNRLLGTITRFKAEGGNLVAETADTASGVLGQQVKYEGDLAELKEEFGVATTVANSPEAIATALNEKLDATLLEEAVGGINLSDKVFNA